MKTPSSSKIGDALRACGISVEQVEKVLRYELPDGTTHTESAPILVDRMQQVALSNLDAVVKIFKHGTP